jgi:hypothetical protein
MIATVGLEINILFADELRLLEMVAQVRRDNGAANYRRQRRHE